MSGRLQDPLTVVTQDGSSWWRKAWDRHGHGLYARSDSNGQCPELWSIRELAEFGLRGMSDVPAGDVSELSEVERLRTRLDEVQRKYTFDTAELKRERDALLAERHTTNEALDDAAEALRVQRDRIAELEAELYTEQAQHRTTLEQRNAHANELLALRGGRATPYTATAEAHAQMREGLTRYFAGQRDPSEGEHEVFVHHDYRKGRDLDLPEMGGAR